MSTNAIKINKKTLTLVAFVLLIGTLAASFTGAFANALSVPLPINETAGIARFDVPVTADNLNLPASPVKLIFTHHSCGENWLADDNGRLGIALRDNNYFVSDTNYGWEPDSIGDRTDIGHWWTWFCSSHSATYLSALYTEYDQHSTYSRLTTDPGGENEIIMFKSCFPNSYLGDTVLTKCELYNFR